MQLELQQQVMELSISRCLKYCSFRKLLIVTSVLLSTGTFGGTIGLAITAIRRPITANGEDDYRYIIWLASATGCGVIYALISTFILWALQLVYLSKKSTRPSLHGISTEPPLISAVGEYDVLLKKSEIEMKRFDFFSLVVLFCSFLCGIFSLLSLLWAIAIALHHSQRTILPFIIVELLVAVACPSLLVFAIILMASVLNFITKGTVNVCHLLPRCLSAVRFEEGKCMLIEDSFYYSLEKRKNGRGFCFTCLPIFPTWILVATVSLMFILVVSHFVDNTISTEINAISCNDSRIEPDFNCFSGNSLVYVDCASNINAEHIYCFKYHQFGVDIDIISPIATSFALYLIIRAIFGQIFLVTDLLFYLSRSWIWGVLLAFYGAVLLLVNGVIILFWITGYLSYTQHVLSQLNVIGLAQLMMVALLMIFVGMLILGGTWVEKRDRKRTGALY